MDLGLLGLVAIVTGGASNIGRAISVELAHEGAYVAIFDRDLVQARQTATDIAALGGKAVAYEVDVTEIAQIERAVEAVETQQGAVSILVNNVGWNGKAEFFLDLPPDRWEKAYRLNLFPAFAVTQAVLRRMVGRQAGSIVSIASDAAFGDVRVSDYGAMKAGVIAFTRSVAKEYGRYGIRANAVAPGLVIPPAEEVGAGSLWQDDIGWGEREIASIERGIPLRRRSKAVDVAWTVAFLTSERAQQLTGQLISVSGGYQMPR